MVEISSYIPEKAKIIGLKDETRDIRTFTLEEGGKKAFFFEPGQFVELSVIGVGESPFSISSAPGEALGLTVKNVGDVTQAMFNLKKGDEVGVRGPFGTHYPLEKMTGRDLVFVAGGFGMASLASAVKHALRNKKKFGRLSLYYGARSPDEFVFTSEIKQWTKRGLKVTRTIDNKCKGWKECVGFVHEAMKHRPPSKDCTAFVCGPPRMIDAAAAQLADTGISEKRIFVSLERKMCCGIGKCGHCLVHGKYVCRDGPVFNYEEAKEVME
ncbi:hypothetical protein AUJ65_01795 [Candidatus Micrarchaeota archaeon CG1_02_51_15]|nr:MAG: hypothetical protein AUJ65_01795 [Candidatus Micrarchaeota archaeon CG1_02_51_15]